jgi:hypothetical protein
MRLNITIRTKRRPKGWTVKSSTPNYTTLDGPRFEQCLGNLFQSLRQVTRISTDEPERENFPGFVNTFADPIAFHKVLMDMLSVMVWPCPDGTLLLNANPDFILNAIPDSSSRLAYGTASGGANDTIKSIHEKKVIPVYEESGLEFDDAIATFVAITSSVEKRKIVTGEASECFSVGMDKDEFIQKLCGGPGLSF